MGIFMGRSVPSADPSTVWLADLIEAAEVLAASAEPCDPAIVRAFSQSFGDAGTALTAVPSALHWLVAQVTMNHGKPAPTVERRTTANKFLIV